MKILYFGGQKSGKSNLAEQKTLSLSSSKPYYIATYNDSFNDFEMQNRILEHKASREDNFITIEETTNLQNVIKSGETYIIDCISMWILNNIELDIEILNKQLEQISVIDANIVFVLNDTTTGVIPIDQLSRKYVDFTGLIGQTIARFCNEVYEVKFGIPIKLK